MKPNTNSREYQTAVSVDLMRRSDAYTIAHKVPSRELMKRAAQGVLDAADWQGKRIAILCGSGNNGGDGYALAGLLAEQGIFADVYRTSEKFSEDGRYYYDLCTARGVQAQMFTADVSLEDYEVLVDCMLGTGFSGEPRGAVAQAITAINRSDAYTISVDINSGMNGDTGDAVLAVRSDLTVSIGSYKTGLFLGRAPELIRDMINVDIGIEILPE